MTEEKRTEEKQKTRIELNIRLIAIEHSSKSNSIKVKH